MRVLLLTHQYFPRYTGGTEMVVRGLAKRLRSAGHEPTVLTYVESPSNALADHGFRITEFDGVPLWELSGNLSCAPHPAQAEYDHPLIAELIVRAARRLQPEVVHIAHAMKFSATIIPRLRAEGFRVVVTLSDYWWLCLRHSLMKRDGSLCITGPDHRHRCLQCAQATHGFAKPRGTALNETALLALASEAEQDAAFLDKPFRRDVLALAGRTERIRTSLLSANRLIALSSFLKRKLVEHGYPAERIEVLHHGIETAPLDHSRTQSPPADTTPKIIFMGTLASHKGPHVLLQALRAAPEAKVSVDLYGSAGVDAAYVAQLHALAEGDARIRFCGLIPPERLGDAFIGASALALPAQWYENDPLVVKAALYSRMPVAASRIGSLEELLTDARLGWLLPADDIAAWAAWIRQLATAPPARVPDNIDVPTADTFFAHMLAIYHDQAPR